MKHATAIILALPLGFLLSCQAVEQETKEDPVGKANIRRAGVQVRQVVKALNMYKTDIKYYPTADDGGLSALIKAPKPDDPSGRSKWNGPYIKPKMLKDPWGNELKYELVEEEQPRPSGPAVHVWSCGPNGKDNSGEGDDIKNW